MKRNKITQSVEKTNVYLLWWFLFVNCLFIASPTCFHYNLSMAIHHYWALDVQHCGYNNKSATMDILRKPLQPFVLHCSSSAPLCVLIWALCRITVVVWLSWSKSEHTNRLTVFSFITPKVSPVAEHDLQVVTLIKCGQDSQQQQYDPQTTGQLQTIHICTRRDTSRGGVGEKSMRFISVIVQWTTEAREKENNRIFSPKCQTLNTTTPAQFCLCWFSWFDKYEVNLNNLTAGNVKNENSNYLQIGTFSKSVTKTETHPLAKTTTFRQTELIIAGVCHFVMNHSCIKKLC